MTSYIGHIVVGIVVAVALAVHVIATLIDLTFIASACAEMGAEACAVEVLP